MECRIKKQCALSIHYATVKVITVFFSHTIFPQISTNYSNL